MATAPTTSPALSWFTPGDVDGFLGLFFSGLPDLLLIAALSAVCGLPQSLMVGRILPGIAISILLGNLFYSWQAWSLAKRTGRNDVTAIPFGVNAPTIFAYIFLIMEPVYTRTHDANLTWKVGVFACLLSGVVQTAGAFCTDWLRRSTPRAALLCPLAGIALAFLCLGFIFGVFQTPAIGILPMVILFALYASHLRLPFRIPAPALAMAVGAVLVFLLRHFHLYTPPPAPAAAPGLYLPHPMNVFAFLRHSEGWRYLSIILPMSLLDTIVSLQILESVKIAGDDYRTLPSLLVNGLATLVAAIFGSPFPTTLYFGHMAHKANGARIGYSALSGITTFILCVTGVLPLVLRVIPIEVAAAVIIWFGLVMMGQAFSEVSASHAIAVALGLIPLPRAVGAQPHRTHPSRCRINHARSRATIWQRPRHLRPHRPQPGIAAHLDGLGGRPRPSLRPPLPRCLGLACSCRRVVLLWSHPRLHNLARWCVERYRPLAHPRVHSCLLGRGRLPDPLSLVFDEARFIP